MNNESRLQIISEPVKRGKEWIVNAQCICGSVKEYRLRYIKSGHTKSCGCILKIHGLTKHPLFKVWQSMKERCYNEKHSRFKDYGGRGVGICLEWKENPEIFIEWAIDKGWQRGLEVDRENNDGNYSPENCRFVTTKVNCRNRRNTLMVTFKQVTKSIPEWAEEYGLPLYLVRSRIKKGWDVERALTRPINPSKNI